MLRPCCNSLQQRHTLMHVSLLSAVLGNILVPNRRQLAQGQAIQTP